MRPFIAQWYADRSRRQAYKDEPVYEPVVYRFDRNNPQGVQPIKNSRESNYLKLHLQKQPTAVPDPIPEGTTLAILLPNYKDPYDVKTFHYASPRVLKHLGKIIYDMLRIELVEYIIKARRSGLALKDIEEDFIESHGMDILDDCVAYDVHQMFTRVMKAYIYSKKKIESCQD